MDAITLTFGDCMENHTGMQKVGEMSEHGYSYEDLCAIKRKFKKMGAVTKLFNLNKLLSEEDQKETETAYFLLVKNGVNALVPGLSTKIHTEHSELVYDKHYYDTRRNKVLNKLARWNLCFDETAQEADYENKKGTIIAYDTVPFTGVLRSKISELTGDHDLKLESNLYYNLEKTGIGYHGDSERKKVVGVRLGLDNIMSFKWFKNNEHIGNKFELVLSDGDIYVMSEKTVGTDWKRRSICTLRHAAGCSKYTA